MSEDREASGAQPSPETGSGKPEGGRTPPEKPGGGAAPGGKETPKPAAAAKEAPPAKPKPKPGAKLERVPERRFVLSSSPHIHTEESVPRIMYTVTLTLLPATLGAAWIFGLRALLLVLIGMAAAVLTEALLQRLFKLPATISDGSALLTGLLVSFNLPPGVPWWIPVIGSLFAIGVGKLPFGGLGYNPLNPALLGRAFLLASWPLHMTKDWLPPFWWRQAGHSFTTWKVVPASFQVDGVSFATPLELSKTAMRTVANPEGVPGELVASAMATLQQLGDRLLDLLVGTVGGCIGETSAVLLLLGAAYLLYKNYIDWRTPISYIAVVAIGGWMFGGVGGLFRGDPLFHIFAGGLILGAFFMATDMVTTPITRRGKLYFGIGCGVLTVLIRLIGGYPEGVSYSILLMNLTTPLIDRWTVPRRFGHIEGRGAVAGG